MTEPDSPVGQNNSEEQSATNGRKRRKSLIILAGVLFLFVIVALPYYLHSRSYVATNDAFVEGHITPVSARIPGHVMAVHVEDNQWVEAGTLLVELDKEDLNARLIAAKSESLQAEINTHVKEINVELAETVSGAAISITEAGVQAGLAGVKATEATLESAQADLTKARADVKEAEAILKKYRADEASKKAQMENDELDHKRLEELTASGTASKQDLDHARTSAKVSQAVYESARLNTLAQESAVDKLKAVIASAESDVKKAHANIEEGHANLAKAQAQRIAANAAPLQVKLSKANKVVADSALEHAQSQEKIAELQFGYASIYAPVSGFVTRKSVEVGAYVQPGQPLLSIAQPDVWVIANYKETQLTHIKPGQPVIIDVDTYPGKSFDGHVDSIQWGTGARFSLLPPENATGNYIKVVQRVPVKIVFDNQEELKNYHIAPGMSVVPEIKLAKK